MTLLLSGGGSDEVGFESVLEAWVGRAVGEVRWEPGCTFQARLGGELPGKGGQRKDLELLS